MNAPFVAGQSVRAVPPVMQSRIADFARYGTEPIPGDGFVLMYSWILALSLFLELRNGRSKIVSESSRGCREYCLPCCLHEGILFSFL